MATIDRREGARGVTWRARVRVNGQSRVRTFPRKKDAEAWASTVHARLTDDGLVPTTRDRRRTVGDMVDRYLADLDAEEHPSSNARNKRRQLLWWKRQIGDVPIVATTADLVLEHRDKLYRDRSAGTVNRYMADLSKLFKVACKEWRWATRNPVIDISKKPEPRGRTRCLLDDERDRLLAACRASSSPALHPIVLLALATGMRKGEILNLRWADVDLAKGRAICRDTKNGEDRPLAIAGPALTALRTWGAVRRIDSPLVFPGKKDPTRPLDIKTAWYTALTAAKLVDFKFHDLRHTTARYLLKAGASSGELAEVLGHRTLSMVKRYTDSPDGHTVAVLEKMNAEIFGGI